MKNIIPVFSLLFLVCIGCFKDKGNYDYTPVFNVSVDSIANTYECLYLADTLTICPQVYPVGKEYEYVWGIYQLNVQGYAPTLDTIAFTKDLSYRVTENPGTYKLIFIAKEKESGISRIVESSLNVTTALSTGWYVLREQDGQTDFDFFAPDSSKVEGVIAGANDGRVMKGKPLSVAYTNSYKSWDEEKGRYMNTNTIFAVSEEEVMALRVADGSLIRDFDNLFYRTPGIKAPQNIYVVGSSNVYLQNAGELHVLDGSKMNSGRLGESKLGDYELSNEKVNWLIKNPLLFDEMNSSFCTGDVWGNTIIYFTEKTSLEVPSANNMDADLLFMGGAPGRKAWTLMKKKLEDMYLLLNMNASCSTPYGNPILSCDTLDAESIICHADCWATNQSNNIIYYAQGNLLYSTNVDAGMVEKEQYAFPENESVTYMRHLKYSYKEFSFDYVTVATHDGVNYKVYCFPLRAGDLLEPEQILEGKGRVGALIYIDQTRSTQLP